MCCPGVWETLQDLYFTIHFHLASPSINWEEHCCKGSHPHSIHVPCTMNYKPQDNQHTTGISKFHVLWCRLSCANLERPWGSTMRMMAQRYKISPLQPWFSQQLLTCSWGQLANGNSHGGNSLKNRTVGNSVHGLCMTLHLWPLQIGVSLACSSHLSGGTMFRGGRLSFRRRHSSQVHLGSRFGGFGGFWRLPKSCSYDTQEENHQKTQHLDDGPTWCS